MFDKMLNDKFLSPRTYNSKKKELENKLNEEMQEILNRKEEAKRVVGFISDVMDGEDQES
jgi:predicted house-cleaning noncanonical NTP pyrophosphatase (MazG superfamily)